MAADWGVDVLVIGAGPGGLASGLTLGSYGLDVLIVDRRRVPSPLPRANTLSTGTMELLRRWRLEGAVAERALDVEPMPLALPNAADAAHGEPIEAGFPTRGQAALISPSAPALLGQDELEPILESAVRAQPGARVERGVELVELRADPHDGLLLELRQPNGTLRHIRAAFVIGADGIHSTVRRELGIAFGGEEGIDTRLAVHFRAPLWDLLGEHRYAVYFLTSEPEGRALVPVGRPDRWALSLPWEAGRETPSLESAWLEEQVWAAAGVADMPVEFDSVSVVDYAVAIAERFRDGNAFLIGDAAHRVTPRGATGLNTAIRDGFDLGWKLAWVLLGWGDDPLLDTYEVERRPVAEFNTARSSRRDGSQLASSTGLQADIGGRIPHVWVAGEDGLVSTLDLLGEGLTLFTGPEWNEPVRGLGEDGPPLSVQRLDAIAARGLGLGPAGSVLVRPDGHPLSLSNPGIGPFSAPLGSFATRSRRNSPQRVG